MSASKHTDKICIAVIAVTLVITILFMCGESLGLTIASKAVKYESTLFDTSYVHKIDIVMDDWDSFIENCENEEYGSCTAVIDGKKQANIAIRAKGNTSLSSVKQSGSQRYSFKLEFDHFEEGKTYDGLDKLCLNNLIQDNTMMKDYIAYVLMNDFGADSPLCSFAYITVNGEDWGLYLAVEGIEDSFLSRNYGSETGELYKPDSMSFGGGRGNGRDFNMDDFDFGSGSDEQSESGAEQNARNSAADTGGSSTSGLSFTNQASAGSTAMPGGFSPPDGMSPPEGFDMPEGMTPPDGFERPEGMTPPEGFDIPEGMTPPEEFDMPEGMTPPDGFPSDGQLPYFPGNDDSGESSETNPDSLPQQPGEESGQNDTGSGSLPAFPGESGGGESSKDSGKSGRPGGFGGGMGSDDVKLKYIDDDPDSYSNIFDNAKTDVSKSDKKRLIESLKKLSSYTELEDVLDMDEVLRYFVVHNFVCNGDSYTGMMIHNYYLHESDGKLSMIPWDYNLAFGTFQGGDASGMVNTSIDSPISMGNSDDRPMLGWIFSDESYTEKYHELFSEFIKKWFSDGELEKLIADTADMIRPYVEKDPTKFCTSEDFEKGVEALTGFVTLRGEAVSRQLSGDDTAVETGSLNLSDMGTMGGGMGKTPGGFSGGFDITSMIKLTDENGEEIALSEVVEDVSSIKEITLSDGTCVDLSSSDMRELMKTDLSKAVSVTDKNGKVIDLSGYTVSISMPSGMNGRSGRPGSGSSSGNSAEQSGEGTPFQPGSSFPGGEKTDTDEQSGTDEESSESGRKSPDNSGSFTPPDGFPGSTGKGSSESSFWILLGISAAVLLAGLLIALKKKY